MKKVKYIAFRYLTDADFFNIYKPSGTELGGGGQSYIDFKVGSVSIEDWERFFSDAPHVFVTERVQGPCWNFKINSIGLDVFQELEMFQRRPQSVAVSSQKITSRRSNRVHSWRPENGFPEPSNPHARHSCPPNLGIYIVKTVDGEFWAGWFQNKSPCRDEGAILLLREMFPSLIEEGHAGFIDIVASELYIDEDDKESPFFALEKPAKKSIAEPQEKYKTKTVKKKLPKKKSQKTKRHSRLEDEITKSLFEEDEDYDEGLKNKKKEVIQKVRQRNTKAVKDLKELYKGRCQITGKRDSFLKKDGTPYCEAHHLLPLGEEGADSPFNIIVVSPLIHRMLHYAETSEIDISKISDENTLAISINKEYFKITWHKDHANSVKKHQKKENED